jgi:hypothetical protein
MNKETTPQAMSLIGIASQFDVVIITSGVIGIAMRWIAAARAIMF